jgi:hypothetical protein
MTKDTIEIFSKDYYTLCKELSKYKLISLQKNDDRIHKFYHYTSIKVFHNIVDNYEFWAHNTRFSNDYTEERIVSEYFLKENKYIANNYFICLCEDGDSLSQWRGYCPDGGVSIELSFPEKRVNFTILGNNAPNVSDVYSSPLPISYLLEGKQKNNNGLFEKELKDNLDYLPLFKTYWFHEEKEYRILFNNKEHFLDKCIFERELDNFTRVPYIKVKFNRTGDLQLSKISTLPDLTYEGLIKNETINVSERHFLTIPACVQQENIYNAISTKLDEHYKNKKIPPEDKRNRITILCEGKPPITGIKIAPIYDHERIKEQIEHLCKTRYWLRDVSVGCSEIPYTYSLGRK